VTVISRYSYRLRTIAVLCLLPVQYNMRITGRQYEFLHSGSMSVVKTVQFKFT